MEVILRQAVENLGKPGDVVKVSNGYARNCNQLNSISCNSSNFRSVDHFWVYGNLNGFKHIAPGKVDGSCLFET